LPARYPAIELGSRNDKDKADMRRVMMAALAAAGGLAILLISVAPAWAASPPTTVSPEGDYIKLGLPAGAKIHESVSGSDTACTTSSKPTSPLGANARNQIPTADNPTTAGPVLISLNRLAMTACTTDAPGVDNVTVQNFGGWKLALQHKASGDTATIRIPKGGSVISAYIAAYDSTCTATVAPDGPVAVVGKWTDGTPSRVTITSAAVPAVTGGDPLCPKGPVTGYITVTFNATNISHPGTPISVT
jgi:hypothetical protein